MNYVVLDTETAPIVKRNDNQVNPYEMRVYDIGWIILNGNTGEVLETRSYIVAETFNNVALMRSAYYADKLPQYHQGAGYTPNSTWVIKPFSEIWYQFRMDCKTHDVKTFAAYNVKFDLGALDATVRDYSRNFQQFFKPYKMGVLDIWDFAGATICNTKKYVKWCVAHGFVSAKGNPSTSAETVHAYLTNNPAYIECHTALEDALIESQILLACLKRKGKKPKSKGQGWRKASKVAKELRK